MKKLHRITLMLALCAVLLCTAALAAGGFNAGVDINSEDADSGIITVTVQSSDVLGTYKPTLTVACDYDYAKVTFNGQKLPSTLDTENHTISFRVAAGGTYTIHRLNGVEFTVTFDSAGGSAVAAQDVSSGSAAAAPSAPSRSGYTFAGWYLGEEVYDFAASVTGDITLMAHWTANPPSVPTTTTTTQKNQDGSSTKTVTNRVTGKVTETTTYTGGAKLVVETTRNGTQTIQATVPKGSSSVTMTIPAKELTATTVAVVVGADGSRKVLPLSVMDEKGLKVALDSSAKLELVDNSKSFEDVKENAWYAQDVAFAASHELFQGYSAATFAPQDTMTRGMLMTVLARVDGVDTSADDGRADWYKTGVEWAVENEVSDGAEPERAITREELAVMLYNMAGKPETGGSLDAFADAGQVSDWAEAAMRWTVEQGIFRGAGGRLYPRNTASRAEVAAILERVIRLMVK